MKEWRLKIERRGQERERREEGARGFIKKIQGTLTINGEIGKLVYNKFSNFCSSKNMIKRMKR